MSYEYHEYPKWVTPEGGEPVVVNDAAEEASVLAPPEPAPKAKRGAAAPTDEA